MAMYVCMCVCVQVSGWKLKPNTLEADGRQYDCPTTCVFAQHSSTVFVSLHFQSCKEKFGTCLKNIVVSIFFYIEDFVSLNLLNLVLCASGNLCTALMNAHNKLNECDTDVHNTHRTKTLNFCNFNQLHMWLELLLSSVILCKWFPDHVIYSCES